MRLERIEDEGLSQYSYVVGPDGGHEVAVVDPRRDIDVYLDWAQQHDARITHVLETHVHADYASGAHELAVHAGAALLLSGHDIGETFEVSAPHQDLNDGDRVTLGSLTLSAVHTPGHTPEHLSFLISTDSSPDPLALLSGDFLFVGSVGRPDLLGDAETAGLAARMYDSVQALRAYPDDLPVFPAHGAGSMCGSGMGQVPSTTLGNERLTNPYLDPRLTRERFVDRLLSSAPPFPPYYRRMKRINAEGPRLLHGIPGQQTLTEIDVQQRLQAGHIVIDLRDQQAFGKGHIPGALGIGAGRMLSMWAAWVVPYDTPLLLVGGADDIEDAARRLVRVGLDDVEGWLQGGMTAWTRAGLPVATTPQISADDLRRQLDASPGDAQILDVRTDAEWAAGHLPGAVHIMGGVLPGRVDEVDRDRPVIVMCGSGYRSTIAASVLARAGVTNVTNLTGGMEAWKDSGFDTVGDGEAVGTDS